MEDDGSCNCECTCKDGSKDVIAADGSCPCECDCKNCDKSTLGPAGCICPNDDCPICKSGAQAEWKNCKCECPEDPCGVPPTCVSGRRGPRCQQPDCGCQDCSGHGSCVSTGGTCASGCQCSRRWTGMYINPFCLY